MRRSEIDAIPLEGDVSFRQRAIEPERAAVLVIDLQKGEYNPEKIRGNPENAYLYERIRDVVIPNGQRLIAACRKAGLEIIYTTIECLTRDGRDRSLDYKVSGIFVPRGIVAGRGHRRAASQGGRHRHPQDFVERVQLHQLRVRAAEPGHRVPCRDGNPHRPMRGIRSTRRLRPRLSHDPGRRCLRNPLRAPPSRSTARIPRLLPGPHHRRAR